LTTHYLEEAEHLCKHVAIIDHGEIIENANMKSLINRLNKQTIVLDIDQPSQHIPLLEGYQHRLIDETTLEVDVHRGQSINELFNLLTQHNINITSMRNKTNRLEELFINLVSQNKKSKRVKNER
jgi:ABC-2 type transport system ATP-binding protein